MLLQKLKGIIYILGQNDSLLKTIFKRVVLKEMFYFCKWIVGFFEFARWRTTLVLKQLKRTYVKSIYPLYIMGDKGKKANFRKTCKPFSILHGQLIYNNTRLVISSIEREHTIISDVHKGLRYCPKAKAMASHCGGDSTIQKISNIFFWHNIKGDVEEFIKKCDLFQKQGKIKKYQVNFIAYPLRLR